VATAQQVQEWQALRGPLLNALWDAEDAGQPRIPVSDLLDTIGARNQPEHQINRLFRNLSEDGLISDPGFGSVRSSEVQLTSDGRYEVERWLAEPDEPTPHLPLPANQVINFNNVNFTGTSLVGSTATHVTTNYGVSGDVLIKLVAQFRELLSTADLPDDDRESIEADLEVIEGEAASDQPRWQRLRPFLRRLRGVVEKGVLAGIEAGTKQETIHLIEQAQQLPGIPG
jgi:hypothetical protein